MRKTVRNERMTVTMYTEASKPPQRMVRQRKSPWREALNEARAEEGEWRRVLRPMARDSAKQTASEVRNGSTRPNDRFGIPMHETWNATYGPFGENWFVWIRFEGGDMAF